MVSFRGVSSGHSATAVDDSNLAAISVERMSRQFLKSALLHVSNVQSNKQGPNSRAIGFGHQGINLNWNALISPSRKDELNDFFTNYDILELT